MRRVDRGSDPAPEALSARKKGKTELERARAHQRKKDPKKGSFEFVAYKDPEVKRRLDALFGGKCAYCESVYNSTAPVDIEHYRPKGAVEGEESHSGYWWIAMVWDNLLPSCIDCNRRRKQVTPASASLLALHEASRELSVYEEMQSGKKDAFPILGSRVAPEGFDFTSEEPCLLDPCRDDPAEHLSFNVDPDNLIGLVFPKSAAGGAVAPDLPLAGSVTPDAIARHVEAAGLSIRGAVSIQVYGLNRLGLVQERTRLLRRLEFLESVAIELAALADELDGPDAVQPVSERDLEIARRLRFLNVRVLAEMKEMARPDAPYSMMAAAWIERFERRLLGSAG